MLPIRQGISNNSFNIWVLKDKNGLSLENYQSSQKETLLPQIVILVFAIIFMDWFIFSKHNVNKK
jgi:hypothetical protein